MTGPERLRSWRAAEGLTTAQAAERLGVSEDTVYAWLSGAKVPSLPGAVVALRVAGIPVESWPPRRAKA